LPECRNRLWISALTVEMEEGENPQNLEINISSKEKRKGHHSSLMNLKREENLLKILRTNGSYAFTV
jgi:hypothetical protein